MADEGDRTLGRRENVRRRTLATPEDWQRFFNTLKRYKASHGHCKVPARFASDPKLARWVLKQRQDFKRGTILPFRRWALDGIGFAWRANAARFDDLWEARLRQVAAFKKRHGHVRIGVEDWHHAATPFEVWVLQQRRLYKDGKLDPIRRQKLEDAGFIWDLREENWQLMRARLAAWQKKHGHAQTPRHDHQDAQLAVWVHNQRAAKRRGQLERRRVRSLNELGFVWEPRQVAAPDDRVAELRAFRLKHGHLAVPNGGSSALTQWMTHKRLLFARGILDRELERKLDAIGFPFTEEEKEWEWFFARAKELRSRKRTFTALKGSRLDRWMDEQRRRLESGEMELDRMARLRQIGFWAGGRR